MPMIRSILFAAIVLCPVFLKAQVPLSVGAVHGGWRTFPHFRQAADTHQLQKKWFVTKYAGLSSGFTAFNGGSATFLSVPMGVQLNRQLTNNVYAFAGIAVAPTYLHYNSALFQPGFGKGHGLMNANTFNTFSSAHLGLMYINNERTFSISGSIGVSRNSYNGYSPLYNPVNVPAVNHYRQ